MRPCESARTVPRRRSGGFVNVPPLRLMRGAPDSNPSEHHGLKARVRLLEFRRAPGDFWCWRMSTGRARHPAADAEQPQHARRGAPSVTQLIVFPCSACSADQCGPDATGGDGCWRTNPATDQSMVTVTIYRPEPAVVWRRRLGLSMDRRGCNAAGRWEMPGGWTPIARRPPLRALNEIRW